MAKMAKVTVIPSTIDPLSQLSIGSKEKLKVAAYARVSTNTDEQYTSYEAQVNYYKGLIRERLDWEYVDVYSDKDISGINTKRRAGFNKMINDALDGKINLIITKSISRFARNTLDTISYVRKLKEKGIEVYFEKENMWKLDQKSELILTIMASIAQEESRNNLTVLLQKLDGYKSNGEVMVIATTNTLYEIPGALLRSGRIDKHIHIPTPDDESRLEILKIAVDSGEYGFEYLSFAWRSFREKESTQKGENKIIELFKKYYEDAKEIVKNNVEVIKSLTPLLIERKILTETEINKHLKETGITVSQTEN